ncbi:MAG TPA: hypothetical protein VIQ24_13435 [Pyrinomonadaceae bacterium]
MKEKNSSLEPENNSHPQKATRKGAGSRGSQAKSDKLVAEVERYRARVADNEERLRTSRASDGTPLTDLQRTNLEEIIARQRARLLELSS